MDGAVTVAFEDQIKAVARLYRGGSAQEFRGTCFAFRSRHIFLTAGHCVRGFEPAELLIKTYGGKDLRVLRVHRSTQADIAVLEGDKAEQGVPYPFTGLHEFEKNYGVGAEVAAFGFPVGGTFHESATAPIARVLRGHVQRAALFADEQKDAPKYHAYELSFPSLLGISGGPVFVPGSDRVFAMMTGSSFTETTPKGHAIPHVISFGMALSLWHVEAWLKEVVPPPGDLRY